MKFIRIAFGFFLLLCGTVLIYCGLGIAGFLTQNGLDLMYLFKGVMPQPVLGYPAAASGFFAAVVGTCIAVIPHRELTFEKPTRSHKQRGFEFKEDHFRR